MKKLALLFFFFSTIVYAGNVFIYGSGTAQNLENKLTFKNNRSIQSGGTNPSTGVLAATGSLYQETDGTLWVKQYGATTAWSRLASASEVAFSFATASTGGDFNIASAGLAYTISIPNASVSNRGLVTQGNFFTFNNKLGTLNGLTGSTQTFATGSAGGDLGFSSVGTTHTLNIPDASTSNRGLVNQTNFGIFNNKLGSLNALTASTQTFATGSSGNDFNISSLTSTHTYNLPDASNNSRGLLNQLNFVNFNTKQAGPLVGDGTTSGTTLTLATVNSNVGSYTNATVVVNAKGLVTSVATGSSGFTESTVKLSTGNGHGATNTRIRRWKNIDVNTGSDITFLDNANNGSKFTINTTGVYAITATDIFSSSGYFGFSRNSAELTTNVYSIATATQMASTGCTDNNFCTVSWIGPLTATDVIREHTAAGSEGSSGTTESKFTITRVK